MAKWNSLDMCVLCGKKKGEVRKLVVGLHGGICCDCIDLAIDILSADPNSPRARVGIKPSANLRRAVCDANQALPEAGLVTMHSGNASGYDPETGLVYIKPSGMDYDALTPDRVVPVRLATGEIEQDGSEGAKLRPSVDLPHHLFLYRNLPGIRGVIHTHSNFATAFAAAGKPIPAVLTAIADEFGGEVPCAPYVDNEGDHIGQAILKYKNKRAPAILMGNHGVFTWGDSPKSALKAAIMVEDVAKTVFLSMQLGGPNPIPQEEIEKWWDRYQNRYGQN